MLVAFQQGDGEDGALLPVGAVASADLSAVQLCDDAAEVQTDACALHAEVVGVAALVEAVKESVGVFVLDAYAVVDDLYHDVLLRLAEHHFHLAAVEGVLEGIAEQVGYHLVEVDAVNPCQHVVAGMLEGEGDVALVGAKLVELADAAYEVGHVGLAAMQLQLVLVDAALVEYLVDEHHQALGIAVDGIDRI